MYCNMVLVYMLFLVCSPPAPCAHAHVSIAKKSSCSLCWCVHRHENSQSLRPSTSSESGTRPLSSQAGMSTNPVPPPRTRKSSSHNSLLLAPATTLLPGSVPDIQAATAIAGHISANQELPYMTPPLSSQETDPQQQQQLNFSGDSQDSSELLAGHLITFCAVSKFVIVAIVTASGPYIKLLPLVYIITNCSYHIC